MCVIVMDKDYRNAISENLLENLTVYDEKL